jgi:hypothetical protein
MRIELDFLREVILEILAFNQDQAKKAEENDEFIDMSFHRGGVTVASGILELFDALEKK